MHVGAWGKLDQCMIDTAVRQWRICLQTCVKMKCRHYEHKLRQLECRTQLLDLTHKLQHLLALIFTSKRVHVPNTSGLTCLPFDQFLIKITGHTPSYTIMALIGKKSSPGQWYTQQLDFLDPKNITPSVWPIWLTECACGMIFSTPGHFTQWVSRLSSGVITFNYWVAQLKWSQLTFLFVKFE